ncbi:hypothetical protein G6F36_008293 [Rhizopus arrhizus]|nr:hypothetical protein G6F36_008293 [Rhizopus arrhizus]
MDQQSVEDISNQEEWPTNTEDCLEKTSNNHHDGQFRHGLGSKLTDHTDVWILDEGGSTNVNKRKRTTEYPVCAEVTRRKIPKLHHQDSDGQQDVHQIYNQGWWHSISTLTEYSSTDPGCVQQLKPPSNIPTYQGDQQCGSGQIIPNQETSIRKHDSKKIFQNHHEKMETSNHRHVCYQA